MNPTREPRRFWRYLGGLLVPVLLWVLFVVVLGTTSRLRGDKEYDEAALREWIDESRPFRETWFLGGSSDREAAFFDV